MGLRKTASIGSILMFLCSISTAEQDDWKLVPGIRAGWITAQTSVSVLEERLGKKNVIGAAVGPEETEPGIVIFPDDKLKKAEVEIDKWGENAMLVSFTISGDKSLWQLQNGITLGTSLKELEKLNGAPVTYSHSGTCAGGTYDFKGGKLSNPRGYYLDGGEKVDRIRMDFVKWSTTTIRYEPIVK